VLKNRKKKREENWTRPAQFWTSESPKVKEKKAKLFVETQAESGEPFPSLLDHRRRNENFKNRLKFGFKINLV